MKWTALLFDLDGTLVDSVPDLAAAVNTVLAEHGLKPLAEPDDTLMSRTSRGTAEAFDG